MKILHIAFCDNEGIVHNTSLPMETWIRDFFFECDYVPENDRPLLIAEYGDMVLPSCTISDIAAAFDWEGLYRSSPVKYSSGDSFEEWLKENVQDDVMQSYAADFMAQLKEAHLKTDAVPEKTGKPAAQTISKMDVAQNKRDLTWEGLDAKALTEAMEMLGRIMAMSPVFERQKALCESLAASTAADHTNGILQAVGELNTLLEEAPAYSCLLDIYGDLAAAAAKRK